MRLLCLVAMLVALTASAQNSGYVNPKLCAGCHSAIAQAYQRTGMGRSFARPSGIAAGTFHHEASDTYYAMLQRDGSYYQRRWEIGFDGHESSVEEKRIDYVMGSGNHARTYLHRTSRGTLEELPLGWYTESGGKWGMNPGYDRPDHPGSRRTITYECMFCHNAYPQIPAAHDQREPEPAFAGDLPEGIDCQRCHGPGARHVDAAQKAGAKREEVRAAIVNPARLSSDRQMEACMQCHLETTSFALPHSLFRFDRGPFSYRPGRPLADFILYFDHPAGAGKDDKFEIAGAAYRLRQSACFVKSAGMLTCTTCHDPHDVPHGDGAARHYNGACRQCHAAAFDRTVAAGKHTKSADCVSCHMPRRRTDDVVHVVMTDHYIQRRQPDRDLLAGLLERHETESSAYRGEVVPYYPKTLGRSGENELYLAVAQVQQQNNFETGMVRLAWLLAERPSARPEFYLELADGWRESGEFAKAIPRYQAALRQRPDWLPALRRLAASLDAAGQGDRALATLQRAVQIAPANADAWHELGEVYLRQGRPADAAAALRKALDLDREIAEVHNAFGVILAQSHDPRADQAFREAVRIGPEYVEARTNLASVLADPREAAYQFERALRVQPGYTPARVGYAELLSREGRLESARRQLDAALAADPNLVEARETLGVLLERIGDEEGALAEYQKAVAIRPEAGRAQLNWGSILARRGDTEGALTHLRIAAKSTDDGVRALALLELKKLGQK
jgi:Tfp pilus assembly protein PilF